MAESRTLRALARALDAGTDPEALTDAINATLVLAGVRSAARLDSRPNDALLRKIQSLGRRRGVKLVRWGRTGAEPLVVAVNRVLIADIIAVQENDNDWTSGSGVAMGRLLGYRCPIPNGDNHRHLALHALVATVAGATANTQKVWLAGFNCGDDIPRRRFSQIWEQKMGEWVGPACTALAGCTVTVGRIKFMIVGFELEMKRPHGK